MNLKSVSLLLLFSSLLLVPTHIFAFAEVNNLDYLQDGISRLNEQLTLVEPDSTEYIEITQEVLNLQNLYNEMQIENNEINEILNSIVPEQISYLDYIQDDDYVLDLPETGIYQNYDNILNDDGTYTWATHLPYFEDYDDHFVPYRLQQDDDMVQIEFNDSKFVFDKEFGAVTVFSNATEIVDSDSYIVKSATVNTDVWTQLEVNNSPIITTVDEYDDNTIVVSFTKENDEGILKIENALTDGTMKTTAFFTNLSLENQKISFTETLQIPNDIKINNGTTINLDNYIGQTFPLEVLEENEDLIIEIQDLHYSSGLGFEQLWSVSIHENRMIALDYGKQSEDVVNIGDTVELDPTFSQTTPSISWNGNQYAGHALTNFTPVAGAVASDFYIATNTGNGGYIGGGSMSSTGAKMIMFDNLSYSGNLAYCYDHTPNLVSGATGKWWYNFECYAGDQSQYGGTSRQNGGSSGAIDQVSLDQVSKILQQGFGKVGCVNGQTCINGVGNPYRTFSVSITYTIASAPSAPQSLTIDTQDVANEITLNWVAPSSNGGASITAYKVYLAGVLIDTLGNVLTYDDTISGGEIGSSLVYHVTAVNSASLTSVASSTASVTAWDIPNTPATPTGVSGTNPTVNWVAPSSDSPITGYKFYRDGSLHATLGNVLTTTDSNSIVSGTTYAYAIKAISAVGESATSSTVNVVAGVPPNAPTGVSASITNTATAPLVVTVTYSASATTGTGTVTGFQLLRDGVAVTTGGLVVTLSDTAPAGGTTYAYTVKALGTHGNSVASSSSSVTTPNTPAQVTGLTVTPVSISRIDLSWNTPSDNNSLISGYKVQISSNGGSSYSDVLTGNVNTVYQSLSLSGNAQYHYKVSAINGVGTGTASDVKNTYTMTTTPASLSSTPVSQVQINLSWGASTGATGYKIESESPLNNGFSTLVNNTGNTDLTRSITSLTTATQYNFKVSGWNNGGTSVASPESNSYTWGILQAPVLDTITRLSPTSLKLDFTTGSGLPVATGYKIERQTGAGWIELIADTASTSLTFTDTVLSSDQTATYRLYAINNIGTSPVSNEKTSDVIASSGGGGGSSNKAVSSQTGITGLIDLTFIDQIHRVILGEFLSKSINVAWDSSENIEVKSIIVSDSPFRIVFQDVPFVLIGDPSGISNGKINYSVQIPNDLCTTQGQINCVEQRQYDIPVEIQTVHKSSTLTKSSVIKIDLAGGSDIPLVFVLLAIGAVPLAFIIRKVGSGKKKRKASGSSHKSSKNGSNTKKMSM